MDQRPGSENFQAESGPCGRSEPAGARDAGGPDWPLTIGEVAREFGVTLRSLRFYENKRLLAPRREGAIRLYGRAERERLSLILKGRRLGFTLAEIAELVAAENGGHSHSLNLTRAKCVEQVKLLERRKREIEAALVELRQIYSSFYERLIERPGSPA